MLAALLIHTILAAAPTSESGKCILRPTYGTPLLLGDVVEQSIAFTAAGKCEELRKSAAGNTSTLILVHSSESQHRALANISLTQRPKDISSPWPILISINSEIPAPEAGTNLSSTWNLYASESAQTGGAPPLAQLFITSSSVTAASVTDVVYTGPDEEVLNAVWSSRVNTEHIAYFASNSFSGTLYNRATLSIPSLGLVDNWTIKAPDIDILESPEKVCRNCSLPTIRQILFRPLSPSRNPLTITAETTRPHPNAGSQTEKFKIRLKIADSAQASSLPLGIADVAYLSCQKNVRWTVWDVIHHNKIAAVSNQSIKNNQCKLVVSQEEIDAAIARDHGIPYSRGTCSVRYSAHSAEQAFDRKETQKSANDDAIDAKCKTIGALKGEQVTILVNEKDDRKRLDQLKALYGRQRAVLSVTRGSSTTPTTSRPFFFEAALQGRLEIALDFGDDSPSSDAPYVVEVAVVPTSHPDGGHAELDRQPSQTYRAKLRPKGPFGITHFGRSLGSKSFRVFATVPMSFTAIRFPAAGLDLQASSDSSIAQLTTLTTGLLLSGEPWDYTRGTNMFAIPFRVQAGLLVSNWYKGVFHPSTFLGGSITLPLWKGADQLDTDLALGIGWEVDLRRGYESFGPRNHLLVTLGLNIFSLFSPESAPKSK